MKNKFLILGLICLFFISCTTSGPKKIYTTDTSTGDVIVPVEYLGGLDTLDKKTKGNLYITNSTTEFVSETGIVHLNIPTSSIKSVYAGEEVKLHFGKTLARMLVLGVFSLLIKDKEEMFAIEFAEEEKKLVINPIFRIKVGTGAMLKRAIQTKSEFAATEKHWETAIAADTISLYEEFLKMHPDSEFAEEARSRLNILKKEKPKEDKKIPEAAKDSILKDIPHPLSKFVGKKFAIVLIKESGRETLYFAETMFELAEPSVLKSELSIYVPPMQLIKIRLAQEHGTSQTEYIFTYEKGSSRLITKLPLSYSEEAGFTGKGEIDLRGKKGIVDVSISFKESEGHEWKIVISDEKGRKLSEHTLSFSKPSS